MRYRYQIAGLLVLCAFVAVGADAQMVASHAPTSAAAASASFPEAAKAVQSGADASALQVTGKAVVKVNGAELTDRDLLREMFALFPYAKLHGGFPKKEEKEIRQGALQMIIFEELVYQEAVRRKMTIAPARITREEHNFKAQFASQAEFNSYLKTELGGSEAKLRQMIKRSLLIEAMLKQEVDAKSVVTLAEARSYYEKNPKAFEHGETFTLQTISIIPPDKASAQVVADARKKAETILAQAKATKNYEQFGLAGGESVGRRLSRGYGRPESGEERQSAPGSGEGRGEDEAGRSERADSAGDGVDDYTGECAYAAGKGDV
jgi:peptidyl-prolyl cis-trans isomerase SurA